MAIVRHKKTGDLYAFLGQQKFRNLRTGVEGEVSDEIAQKCFAINLEATALIGEYPMLEEFIKALNLKLEK
jgi:hypothetical protein